MKSICVFGASSPKLDDKYMTAAFELGAIIAENNISLVFGAGDAGIMGAVARGASSKNGNIIGVIPEKLNVPGIPYEKCTELIVTPTMHERKAKMESMSDAFVALPGGFGTFEELLEVITLKQLGYISSPICILNTDGYYDNLIAMFETCIEESFAPDRCRALYSIAESPSEVIDKLSSSVMVDGNYRWKWLGRDSE